MNINTKQYAVIVDPTSSGSLIAGELKKHNIDCIAVHSQPLPDIPVAKTFVREDYCEELTLQDDYQDLIRRLAEFEPVGIFAGNEPGVRLADRLIHEFGFPGNDFSLTTARTNKYEMQEALRRAGLRAIEQIKSADLEVILEWLAERDRFPVFVKPLSSGGTDGVRLCGTVERVKSCFRDILASKNNFGFPNTEVLVQEYIRGSEYVVDSTSCNGKHFAVDICKYRKFFRDNGAPLYREMRFQEPDPAIYRELIEYNEKALDALGVRYGSSHSEIMLTDTGPVLIESGARLCGAYAPRNVKTCARFSQIEMTVDSVLFPDVFFEKMQYGQKFLRHGTMLFLYAERGGVIRSFPGRELIEGLGSFGNAIWRVSEGEYLPATVDLGTSPGMMFLANDDLAALDADVAHIEALENENRLFVYA